MTPVLVHGEIDPHACDRLTNGDVYVQKTANAMSEKMPDHATEFQANAGFYISTIYALHTDTLQRLAALSEDHWTVVIAQDAFGCLADACGVNFIAPSSIDTEAEPAVQELAALTT